jgi:ABC-type polysaccharide/polyol phosphate export permease
VRRAYPCAYDPHVEASAITPLRPAAGSWRRQAEVIGALTRSDLKVRYGRGRLSTVKWLLDPFAAVGVYLLLVAFVLNRQGFAIGLSIACAVVPFQMVMMTIINALRAVDLRRSVITNMAFDKSLIPVASMCTEAVGFSACFVLLGLLMAVYGVTPNAWILMLPLVVLVTLFFAVACAFPAAVIGLWLPELSPFVMSAARATYFVAPGLVSLRHIFGHTHDLLKLNPLTGLFEGFRDALLYGQAPQWWELVYPTVFGVVLIAAIYPLWRRDAPHFAKVL